MSWCSSVSELLFIWKPDFLSCKQNHHSAPLLPLFIPSRERALCRENVLKATAVEVTGFLELVVLVVLVFYIKSFLKL